MKKLSWEPSEDDVYYYVAFVQYFILGRMNVADSLYQQKNVHIERVAGYLQQRHPPKQKPLYRGWIVEPEKVVGNKIRVDHQIPMSFTHDRGVACFFADPKTMISDFLMTMRPRARGYVMKLTGWNASQVLWTYEWQGKIPSGFRAITTSLTTMSVQGIKYSDHQTIESNLKTQKEVILKPLPENAKTTLTPLAQADCPSTSDLDRRYGGASEPARSPVVLPPEKPRRFTY
jgi:hypothetical protein